MPDCTFYTDNPVVNSAKPNSAGSLSEGTLDFVTAKLRKTLANYQQDKINRPQQQFWHAICITGLMRVRGLGVRNRVRPGRPEKVTRG